VLFGLNLDNFACFLSLKLWEMCWNLHLFSAADRVLMVCAKCALRTHDSQTALKFMRKRVEMVWWSEDEKSESRLYDDIGYCFYLLGDIQQAKNFHKKYLQFTQVGLWLCRAERRLAQARIEGVPRKSDEQSAGQSPKLQREHELLLGLEPDV